MKIALITGASSGLGKEFAIQIAKKFDYIDEIWLIARKMRFNRWLNWSQQAVDTKFHRN